MSPNHINLYGLVISMARHNIEFVRILLGGRGGGAPQTKAGSPRDGSLGEREPPPPETVLLTSSPQNTTTSTLRCSGSAELKGPRQLLRIRPEIFDFRPDLGLEGIKTKPKIPGTVPSDRHTTIPNDSGPISACSDDDPKLLSFRDRRCWGGLGPN